MRLIVALLVVLSAIGCSAMESKMEYKTKYRGFTMDVGRFDEKVAAELACDWNANIVRYHMRSRFLANRKRISYAEAWKEIVKGLPAVLDAAKKYGITIVLDLHGRTPNDNAKNYPKGKAALKAFWNDDDNRKILLQCWRDVATLCKDREEEIWFDLLNEPLNWDDFPGYPKQWPAWAQDAVNEIRKIDQKHAIVVETGPGGLCWGFKNFPLLKGKNIIYSLHQYQPHAYTHQGIRDLRGTDLKHAYMERQKGWPGTFSDGEGGLWNKDRLRKEFEPVLAFQKKHGVRIFVGEFSVARWAPNAADYLKDTISLFEEYGWDWAYHAFRESKIWSLEHEGTFGKKPLLSKSPTDRAEVVREFMQRNERK